MTAIEAERRAEQMSESEEQTEGETTGQRAERSDSGRPRLTRRDLQALAWLEEMRAVYETDLAVLLGRLSSGEAVSVAAARAVVRRWEALGLARAEKVFAHEARFVWLTLDGARLVANAVNWKEPGWGVMRHTAMVARVRLWLEQRGLGPEGQRSPVTDWTSERRWRQAHLEAVRAGTHVPDGIAHTEDGRAVPVEVELSDKGPTRALEIAVRLTTTHETVVYVVPAGTQTERTVRGALDEASRRIRRQGDGHVGILALPTELQEGGPKR